ALDRQLRDLADAPDEVLVVQDARFQRGGLRGPQGVAEGPVRHGHWCGEVDTLDTSSAWPWYPSWRNLRPGCGWACMNTPGWAPSTPAWKDPSVLTTWPWRSSSAVSSPKYQTLPQRSWA